MKNANSNQPPIACDLTVFSLGEREHYSALSQELFAACGKMRELPDGFAFLFPGKGDRKSTRLNSSHDQISYAVFCLKKNNNHTEVINDPTNIPITLTDS